MELTELMEQLDELEKKYREWVEPINKAYQEGLSKIIINKDGYTWADRDRDVKAVEKKQKAKYDPYQPIIKLLDEICPAYLEASPEQRASVRAAVSNMKGVLSSLIGYAHVAAERIKSPEDREWLRKGLAAISIEDCCQDWRDDIRILSILYSAAKKAGIKPKADFQAVSRLSSNEKHSVGDTSTQTMLARFHTYPEI